jgi:hypothetical protein
MQKDFDPKLLGGSVKRNIVNPDLVAERKKCTFDQKEAQEFLWGIKDITVAREIQKFIEDNKDMQASLDFIEMDRNEKLTVAWRQIYTIY